MSLTTDRAKTTLSDIVTRFNMGELTIENQLLGYIASQCADFCDNLGKPTLEAENMIKGSLLRIDYLRKPMEKLDYDLGVGYSEVDDLRVSVKGLINLCAIERKGLQNLADNVNSKVDRLQLWVSDSDPTYQWVGDSFTTDNLIDSSNTNAHIEVSKGYAQLASVSSEALGSHIVNISIDKHFTSDEVPEGLPGNNFEVLNRDFEKDEKFESTSEEINSPIIPNYAKSAYKDSSDIRNINDGDATTWFEWEKYIVPVVQKVVSRSGYVANDSGREKAILTLNPGDKDKSTETTAKNYGSGEGSTIARPEYTITRDYGWKSSIMYPDNTTPIGPYRCVHTCLGDPKNQKLTLTFTIELDTDIDVTWMELLPYLPNGLPFTLDSVKVRGSESTSWKELIKTPIILNKDLNMPSGDIPVKTSNGIAVIPCNETAKFIKVSMTQDKSYDTKIAHKFYRKETQVNESASLTNWEADTSINYERVSDAEVAKLTSTDKSGGESAMAVAGAVIGAITGGFIGGFMGLSTGSSIGKAVFGETTKTVLGVRELYDIFRAYRFAMGVRDFSMYRKTYTQTSIIQSAPLYFGKEVKAVSLIVGELIPDGWGVGKWIKYEVSTNASDWKEIIPQINDLEKSVVEIESSSVIYFRATLSRPSDKNTQSPTLTYYAIKGLPND